ncbi:MAG TPA: SWIM zinc finger family protein [Rhodothermales bacterium]|nr:SWIM zinc finger family protein [Rhodothermales bacterium]
MLPGLTEAFLWQHASAEVVGRGQDYYASGAVTSVVQRGREIQAQVEGSSFEPYQVRITFDDGGITEAGCSCPYDWGGWCKHVVAVLLTCLRDPDAVDERPSLDILLQDMSREQLIDVLRDLAAHDPDLTARVELAWLQKQAAYPNPSGKRKTAIDEKAVRRRVQATLHALDSMRPSQAYWHVGEVVNEVRKELEQAQTFIEAGDGRNALRYLEAITDGYVDGWINLDDSDGEASGLFVDLAPAWTEALLTADLSADERADWVEKLAAWQDEIEDYGIEDGFQVAVAAAEEGWDDPALRRVLEGGEITERGAWPDEAPWYADELAEIRLKILDRQGRHQEYLRLAEAEGQFELYLTMLVRLGRTEEAVEKGLASITWVDGASALARVLREQGALEEALRVAKHGLTLEGRGKAILAAWLSELAAGMGRLEDAREAALVAFSEAPALDTYRRVQNLMGTDWPQYRERLLDQLRTRKAAPEASVNIFLEEGMIDDAIVAVDRQPAHYALVRRVAEAAAETRPEWVIRAAKQQAEPILDAGQSNAYHHAVDWLALARAAYRRLGQEDECHTYLTSLKEQHGRKRKLMSLMNERRF